MSIAIFGAHTRLSRVNWAYWLGVTICAIAFFAYHRFRAPGEAFVAGASYEFRAGAVGPIQVMAGLHSNNTYYRLHNNSTIPLNIDRAWVSESWASLEIADANFPMIVPPGESAPVTLNIAANGRIRGRQLLRFKAVGRSGTERVEVDGDITIEFYGPLNATPPIVRLGEISRSGPAVHKAFSIWMPGDLVCCNEEDQPVVATCLDPAIRPFVTLINNNVKDADGDRKVCGEIAVEIDPKRGQSQISSRIHVSIGSSSIFVPILGFLVDDSEK